MQKFGKFSFLIATLALLALMFVFFSNLNDRFDRVEADYKNGMAINLNDDTMVAKSLAPLLVRNGYVKDTTDAKYIADTLAKRTKKLNYSYLYILQKRAFGQVPAREAKDKKRLTKQLENSRKRLGHNDTIPALENLNHTLDMGATGGGKITVAVKDKDGKACDTVAVRLMMHYADTSGVAYTKKLGFAKTNAQGIACFTGLDKNTAYSVLPIKDYYEYGSEKGVKPGDLAKKDKVLSFEQWEHRIRMFDNTTLKLMKQDGAITVRTPEQYREIVMKWFLLVVGAWWALALFLKFRKKNFDPWLLSAAMFLTGLCVIIMFAIQNPLTEELRGVDMASGVLIGIALVFLLQFVDFIKLYQQKYIFGFDIPLEIFNWIFLPFKQKISRQSAILKSYYPFYRKFWALLLIALCSPLLILDLFRITRLSKYIEPFLMKLPKGIGWFFLAFFLTLLLWTPLAGIIGGMRVNLVIGGLTFQPSEIAKYLILFFVAAFFTQKADTIIQYSMPNKTKLWEKVKTLSWVICGLIVLMGLYAVLGDMGPGLVIGVTFVILYSLVKSKVDLDNLNESDKWIRILTCDFAMMIYGVLSFALFIVIGAVFDMILVMGLLWFVCWILLGWLRKRQFYETAFIINMLIFMFVFGGKIINSIPGMQGSSLAVRFENRTEMCTNTWGDLDIENAGENADPVTNSQVANGLWAIATGGTTGQGLGNGTPSVIPAFHTDMILSSLAEMMGFWGLVLVVVLMGLLLRRIAVTGYKAGHPFAFYFCMGVAIVTGVQFFIIALGGSGMIPLTGITVPFLSYGRVSMILNLVAFGVVLSMSQNMKRDAETKPDAVADDVVRHNVGEYNYPVSIVSWTFVVIALVNVWTWYFYAAYMRDETLIHPAYVQSDNNNRGLPVVEYNPRIVKLERAMFKGNIYDRNGLLIATSDKDAFESQRAKYLECGIDSVVIDSLLKSRHLRLYPFGEHLYFMLGDQQTGLYQSYDKDDPYGYLAENQHLSYLRDYDTKSRKIKRVEKVFAGDRFLKNVQKDTLIVCRYYDYSPLLDYLKEGTHGNLVEKHNNAVREGKCHLDLTVDATLQMKLQDTLDIYLKKHYSYNNILRASVVILDANTGELLTSANYPLPDYKRLREEYSNNFVSYNDSMVIMNKTWTAFTERDLGMTLPTMPGSTAKLMSALAGLNKLGADKVRNIYDEDANFKIYRQEVIDINKDSHGNITNSKEPPMNYEPVELVSMRRAIVKSSNCYFIHLVDANDLFFELDDIYSDVGVSIYQKKTYVFYYESDTLHKKDVEKYRNEELNKYKKYNTDKANGKLVGKTRTMRKLCRWAWGQGEIDASPLNMARVASAIVNGGKMPITRYSNLDGDVEYVELTGKDEADELKSYMYDQAHDNGRKFPDYVGGKTGTPERELGRDLEKIKKDKKANKDAKLSPNDAWYVFYIDNQEKNQLAVAIRMERISYNQPTKPAYGSGKAMELANVVLKVLEQNNYIDKPENNKENK